jgi:acetyl esterase/lipase
MVEKRGLHMKKKNIFLIAIGLVVVVLIAGILAFPLLSQSIYGRSQAATLFAWQLSRDSYESDSHFVQRLNDAYDENSQAYTLPDTVDFSVPITETDTYGLQAFELNPQDDADTLIVYFPGGSYLDAPRATHWQFLNDLAADTGATIVVPIYPKLPQYSAQESYEAVLAFYEALIGAMDYDRLLFMGDSAGGGMALSLAMQVRDAGLAQPDELVLICPWVDVTMENPDIADYAQKDPSLEAEMLSRLGTLWAGELSTTDSIVSPLYGDLTGLGHIYLFTTTGELLYPDIMRLDEALTDAGTEHTTYVTDNMFHIWPLFASYNIPESQQSYQDIVSIITQ